MTGQSSQLHGMTEINRENYHHPHRVNEYVTDTLRPAEVMMFVKYRDELAGRRVMDIGCGAGRVTQYLARWTPYVVGVDFSSVMIDYCKRAFPNIDFHICDVRELAKFGDEAIDVALFTFNGIDTLSHEARLSTLAGIRRLLSPGGLFIFSAHNRNYRYAHQGPRLRIKRNPISTLANVVRYGREVANHQKRKPMEREEREYALINDLAHDFTMVHYYIDRHTQDQQLRDAGLELVETYAEDAHVLGPGDDDSLSGELYYVARKVRDGT